MLNKAGEDAKPARHAGSRQDGMPSCGSTHTTDAALLLRPALAHRPLVADPRRQKDATTSAPLQAPRSARERAAADNKLGTGAEAGAGPGPQQKKRRKTTTRAGRRMQEQRSAASSRRTATTAAGGRAAAAGRGRKRAAPPMPLHDGRRSVAGICFTSIISRQKPRYRRHTRPSRIRHALHS